MRVNLEIRDVDMTFPLHLFILRREDIYYLQISLSCIFLDPNHGYPLTSFLLNRTSIEANMG